MTKGNFANALIVGILIFVQPSHCDNIEKFVLDAADDFIAAGKADFKHSMSIRKARNVDEDSPRELWIKLCVLEIKTENYPSASDIIAKLNDNSALEQVIDKAYNNLDIDKIIKFLRKLKTQEQVTFAAEVVYKKLEENAKLMTSPHVLDLGHEIVQKTLYDSSGSVRTRLNVLKSNLDSKKNSLLIHLGEKVRELGCKEDTIKKYFLSSSGTIDLVLEDIIENAYYLSKGAIKNILKCVDTLTFSYQTLAGYRKLFDLMKAKNHLCKSETFLLAYKLIKRNKSYNGYGSMINELSWPIKHIIWGDTVYLKNQKYNEYIYVVTPGLISDGTDRRVFTWVPEDRSDDCKWRFETDDEGETFYMKNVEYSQYLYSDSNDYYNDNDKEETWIHTSVDRTNHNSRWVIEPYGNAYIMLKNWNIDGYLYAADNKHDDNRRRCFVLAKRFYLNSNNHAKQVWLLEF